MNGGGVWIAMGPRGDVEHFNQSIYAAGDGLSALAIEGIVSEPDPKKSPTINPAGRGHPATAELADSNRLDTTDIRVRRRFSIRAAHFSTGRVRTAGAEQRRTAGD